MSSDEDKRAAARAAVAEVTDGMRVGLGTGSTAAHMIRALGERVAGGLTITAVSTSHASAQLAASLGIAVLPFEQVARIDLTIDGADEIDGVLRAVKGAGGAMLREKIVAAASTRMVVIADGSKRVERLGTAPVPVEVLPFGQAFVAAKLAALGARAELRQGADAPYRTDGDNLVFDCHFPALDDPEAVAAALARIPGMLGHGLFLDEVDAAYFADGGVVTRVERGTARR